MAKGKQWCLVLTSVCLAVVGTLAGVAVGRGVGQVVRDRWLSPAPAASECKAVEPSSGAGKENHGQGGPGGVAGLWWAIAGEPGGVGGASKVEGVVVQDRA